MARILRSATKANATTDTNITTYTPIPAAPQQVRFPPRRTSSKPKSSSKLPPKTESQASFTQFCPGWISRTSSSFNKEPSGGETDNDEVEVEFVASRPRKLKRRRTTLDETEVHQPTYTQAVRSAPAKRAKRPRVDAEGFQVWPDGTAGKEQDVGLLGIERVRQRLHERRLGELECTDWRKDEADGDETVTGRVINSSPSPGPPEIAESSSQMDLTHDEDASPAGVVTRTPSRVRFTETIPSSQTPASHASLSTQRSARFRNTGRSPLKALSLNQQTPAETRNPSQSPEKSITPATIIRTRRQRIDENTSSLADSTRKLTRKTTVQDSQHEPFPLPSSLHEQSPAKPRPSTLRRKSTVQDSQCEALLSSPHQARVSFTPVKPKRKLRRVATVQDSQVEDLYMPAPMESDHGETPATAVRLRTTDAQSVPPASVRSTKQRDVSPSLHHTPEKSDNVPAALTRVTTVEDSRSGNSLSPSTQVEKSVEAGTPRKTLRKPLKRVTTIQDSDCEEHDLPSPVKAPILPPGSINSTHESPLEVHESKPNDQVADEEYYDDGDEGEDEYDIQNTYDPADEALDRDAARFGETQKLMLMKKEPVSDSDASDDGHEEDDIDEALRGEETKGGTQELGLRRNVRVPSQDLASSRKESAPLYDDDVGSETEDELHDGDDELDFNHNDAMPAKQPERNAVETNDIVEISVANVSTKAPHSRLAAQKRAWYSETMGTTQSYYSPARNTMRDVAPTQLPSKEMPGSLPHSTSEAMSGHEEVILIPSSPPASLWPEQMSTQLSANDHRSPRQVQNNEAARTAPAQPVSDEEALLVTNTNPPSPSSGALGEGEASYPNMTIPSSPLPFEHFSESLWNSYKPPEFLDLPQTFNGSDGTIDLGLGSMPNWEDFSLPAPPPLLISSSIDSGRVRGTQRSGGAGVGRSSSPVV